MIDKAPRTRTPGAFEEFVESRQHRLLRAAFLVTGDLELAKDLLHEALTKLALAWPTIRADPDPYLRILLYRSAVSWRQRRHADATWALPAEAPDPAGGPVLRSPARGLASLTAEQRAVLVLRYFENQSVAVTARVLGVPASIVESQTLDALGRLRGLGVLAAPGEA